MFRRMSAVGLLLASLALVAGVGWLTRRSLREPRLQLAFTVVVLLTGLDLFKPDIGNRLARVRMDRAALEQAAELRTLLVEVTGRPLIAADSGLSLLIPAVKVSAVMAPSLGNGNPGDPEVLTRAAARAETVEARHPIQRRQAIIAQYGIAFLVTRAENQPLRLVNLQRDP